VKHFSLKGIFYDKEEAFDEEKLGLCDGLKKQNKNVVPYFLKYTEVYTSGYFPQGKTKILGK